MSSHLSDRHIYQMQEFGFRRIGKMVTRTSAEGVDFYSIAHNITASPGSGANLAVAISMVILDECVKAAIPVAPSFNKLDALTNEVITQLGSHSDLWYVEHELEEASSPLGAIAGSDEFAQRACIKDVFRIAGRPSHRFLVGGNDGRVSTGNSLDEIFRVNNYASAKIVDASMIAQRFVAEKVVLFTAKVRES